MSDESSAWRAIPVLSLLALAGCAAAPQPRQAPQTAGIPVINAPRAERGNPPEYQVMGRRYRVMHTSDGYRDTGVASWYGRDFHGKSTSSGEPYDMFAMTAAHKTLPIPTWVEVTNQRNGRSVIVKVNDRGPFVDDRIIDLSYAAAMELDMVTAGTAPVFVRALGAPATMPVTADASPAPAASSMVANLQPARGLVEQIFVQVGAFSDYANASRLMAQLRSSGFLNASVMSGNAGTRSVHRVRLGPLRDTDEFEAISTELQQLGLSDVHLVVERFDE